MEKSSSANAIGRAYRCLHCLRNGKADVINSKQRLEDHVYKYHIPNDMQPYWCRLCLFRCRTKEALLKHVDIYPKHKYVMAENGIQVSRPFLVTSLNPHIVDENDIEVLTKEESMLWWTKKQLPLSPVNIIERAAREANLNLTDALEDPLAIDFPDMNQEAEQAILDLRIVLEREQGDDGRVKEGKREMSVATVSSLDEPLDLRIVKASEGKTGELDGSNLNGEDTLDKLGEGREAGKGMKEGVAEKSTSGEKPLNLVKGAQVVDTPDDISIEGLKEEALIYEEEDHGREESQDRKSDRKRVRTNNDRSERSKKRVRHTLKRYRSASATSSASSSSSSDSESDSENSKHIKEREQRFTDILGEMVRKTGEIVANHGLENAALINKLQSSIDSLRKEVAELKELKVAKREPKADNKQEERRTDSKEARGHDRVNEGSKRNQLGKVEDNFRPRRQRRDSYGRFGYNWGAQTWGARW